MSDSIFSKIGGVLRDKGLPLLGAAVGGPAGASLGGMLANALGSESEDPEKLLNIVEKADPKTIINLKQVEFHHKEKLQDIALQTTQVFLADRQSARQREMEVVKATGKKDINLYILAWTVVLGYAVLTGVVTFVDIPETNNEAAFMLFGGLVSGFSMVLGYFFGSSQGSNQKNEMLEKLQTRIQTLSGITNGAA